MAQAARHRQAPLQAARGTTAAPRSIRPETKPRLAVALYITTAITTVTLPSPSLLSSPSPRRRPALEDPTVVRRYVDPAPLEAVSLPSPLRRSASPLSSAVAPADQPPDQKTHRRGRPYTCGRRQAPSAARRAANTSYRS